MIEQRKIMSERRVCVKKRGERVFALFLFDLILYVHSTIFQLCGTVLPGFNQY